MGKVELTKDELDLINTKFVGLYKLIAPYLSGTTLSVPNEPVYGDIMGAFGEATYSEYNESTDEMSDDGIKLEDIWSKIP